MFIRIRYLALLFLLICLHGNSQEWKNYPYQPEGSILSFPEDEGFHPGESTEWWYINAHVTGQSTGHYYTFMLSYFYNPAFTYDGFRIFNLSNETTGEFYDESLPCTYESLAEDSLNITTAVGWSSTHYEEWVTQTDSNGTMKPFRYHVYAVSGNGSADINCNAVKPPLIVADSGYLYQGAENYTYYYSQTMLEISGTLTFNSTTEDVSGIAWLDHQFGSFNPNEGEKYEWFCIQLENGMDLNVWNIFTESNKIPDTSTYRICCIYINDSSAFTTQEFNLERLKYAYSIDSVMCYAQKWRLTVDTFDIDLIVETQNSNHEVELPFRFFEGGTIIQGTVQGIYTEGKGFAELLHSYEKPDIEIVRPDTSSLWTGTDSILWKIKNPDQGNKLLYDVEISNDDKNTFRKIARAVTDTDYYWNPAYFIEDTAVWLRITGYSADSTLAGVAENLLLIQAAQRDYQLCNMDSITFLVMMDESEKFTYQWQKNMGNIEESTDSIYFLDSLTADDNGNYRCIVSGSIWQDTTVSYALSVESCGPEANDKVKNEPGFITYTNNGSVKIVFSEYFTGSLEVINLSGEIIKINQLEYIKDYVLDVSDLSGGFYFIRVRNRKINSVKKFMINNH